MTASPHTLSAEACQYIKADQAFATWEELGILPPGPKNYPGLSGYDAAKADRERLAKEIHPLILAGKIPSLPFGLFKYAVECEGLFVRRV